MIRKKQEPNFRTFYPTLFLLVIIGSIATDIYIPSLSQIRIDFKTSVAHVQLTLTVYILMFCICQIAFSPLSDRYGRKVVVMTALAVGVIASVFCMFSFGVTMLLVGRALQGACMGVVSGLARVISKDVYSGHRLVHVRSLNAIGRGIAIILAPVIGGYIEVYFGWKFSFLFTALLILIVFSMSVCWMPETNVAKNKHALKPSVVMKSYSFVFKSPIFMFYSLASSLATGGFLAYITISPFLVQDVIGLSAERYGLLSFVIAAGMGLGGWVSSGLTKFIGVARSIMFAAVMMFLGGAALLISGIFEMLSVTSLMMPMFFYMIGVSQMSTLPFVRIGEVCSHVVSSASGLYGFLKYFGAGVVSFIATLFHVRNQIPLGSILACTGILAFIFVSFAEITYIKNNSN